MKRVGAPRPKKHLSPPLDTRALEPWWAEWQRLTPCERLRRSWAMRKNLKDPLAAHDAKSLPGI